MFYGSGFRGSWDTILFWLFGSGSVLVLGTPYFFKVSPLLELIDDWAALLPGKSQRETSVSCAGTSVQAGLWEVSALSRD
jgi:hypothetical protein